MRAAGGQVHGGGPALGPGMEVARLVLGQLTPAERREAPRLLLVERQVFDPDLDQPTARAQPGEGQSRVGATGDGDRDVGRQVVDHHGQRVDRRGARQVVHIVDHQHQRTLGLVQRRGQPRNGVGQRGRAIHGGPIEHRHAQVERALDREADVGEEADRVGIGGIAGDPRDRPALLCPPQGEARGLAVAGRGDHRDEAGVGAQQPPQQCLPWQHGRPEVWRGQLRLHERLADRRGPGMQGCGQGVVSTTPGEPWRMSAFCASCCAATRSVIDRWRPHSAARQPPEFERSDPYPRRLGWSRTRARVKSADRRIGSSYSQPRRRM